MTNLFEKFKTEDDFEVDGVWKEYYGSAKIKLARAGNKNTEYYKFLRKSAKKYENAGTDTKADQERPWAEVFSKTVIKGWQVKEKDKWVDGIHLPDEKGNITLHPFNQENVVKTLLMLPDFFAIIKEDADNIKTFQKEKRRRRSKKLIKCLKYSLEEQKNGWKDKILKERGKKIEKKDPPVLPPESLFIWDAFWDLTTDRDIVEGGVCPIPWRVINEYAYRYGINDSQEFDSFCYFIRRIDNEYRDIKTKEINRQRDLQKNKNRRGGR